MFLCLYQVYSNAFVINLFAHLTSVGRLAFYITYPV